MSNYSKTSLERLSTCHPDLQIIFKEVIKYFDCTIACGFRNQKEQDDAFARGATEVKWPNGNHNKYPSMAVDAYPCPVELNATNQREKNIYIYLMSYFAGQVMAIARQLKVDGKISHNLRWGCDWDGDNNIKEHSFLDFPHFELVP